MATRYNINLIGSLTNTNGVLSGFSTNTNYATFSGDTFSNNDVEIVFKTSFNRVTSDGQICYSFYDSTKTYSLCDIGLTGGKFYFEITNGDASLGDISGTTTVIANTDYYIKAVRNNTTYTLYSSTNGTNWTTEGTLSNITFPSYTSATNYIGGFAYNDNGFTIDQILDGTVDLNESYIKVGGQYLWRGVTNTTTIQLRRDTASNWSTVNPVLAEGEVGIETDTGKSKFGDGSTSWNNLPYNAGSIAATTLNSKADTDLSNLSATGKTVIDGQWQNIFQEAIGSTAQTINTNSSKDIEFSSLPTKNCEVMFSINQSTNYDLAISSYLLSSTTNRALKQGCITVIMPVSSNKKITVRNLGSGTASINFVRMCGYRVLGTNTNS